MNGRAFLALLLLAAGIGSASPGHAQSPVPGEACTADRAHTTNSGAELGGAGHYMVCEGGTWKSYLSVDGSANLTKIGNLSCNADEVLKFNGTIWECADEGGSDTLASLGCTDGQVASWDDGGSAWVCSDISSGAPEPPICTGAGKALQWDGSAFQCADLDGGGGGGGSDTTPDAFSFVDVADAALGTQITSNSVTISGINTATPVYVSGGQIRINGGSWLTDGTIINGQTLEVRLTSAITAGTTFTATVEVGGVTDDWSVTTAAPVCPGTPGTGDIGCIRPDGSIFAGDTNLYVTDENQGSGVKWGPFPEINSGAQSETNGQTNQTWIVANRTLSEYQAFEVCENLDRHGHTDWYLPAKDELDVVYQNRGVISGLPNIYTYWSSTEDPNNPGGLAWAQFFFNWRSAGIHKIR